MHTARLRKVGGSIVLAEPPALLGALDLRARAKVGLSVRNGRLVVEPRQRPRYTLDELLAQCNPKGPRGDEHREWLDDGRVGGELIGCSAAQSGQLNLIPDRGTSRRDGGRS